MTEKDPLGKDPSAGGAKLDDGKPMASLLADFGRALLAVAEVSTFGAKKYSRGGWKTVPDGRTRYADALWRHLLKSGHEEFDQDALVHGFKIRHKTQVIWNALAELQLLLTEETAASKARMTTSSMS